MLTSCLAMGSGCIGTSISATDAKVGPVKAALSPSTIPPQALVAGDRDHNMGEVPIDLPEDFSMVVDLLE